ncbi:MoaD family protein [uncultured Methanoregula sp.]|uniref:MoaD/ThiS family protein n=1 Tax=uncultured Methanoregula sp. TaxID=1005933 RepID=UPI002AAC2D82|nr:MoaD family protein [uncultured Methanoregula sp.]
MTVKIRFFARFRELLGTDILAEPEAGTPVSGLIRDIAGKNREGYDAIFDENGRFREFVILMRNGKRVELTDAAAVMVADGDEIAVFPPVAGG